MKDKLEDINCVVRSLKSKKDRQYNSQSKRGNGIDKRCLLKVGLGGMNQTNTDLQNTRQKLKITRTSLKLGDELVCSSDIEIVLDTSISK